MKSKILLAPGGVVLLLLLLGILLWRGSEPSQEPTFTGESKVTMGTQEEEKTEVLDIPGTNASKSPFAELSFESRERSSRRQGAYEGAPGTVQNLSEKTRFGQEPQRDRDDQEESSNLAPVHWMAPIVDHDVDAIERDLDAGEMRQAEILTTRAERRRSIELVSAAITPCIAGLPARTAIGMQWELTTEEGLLLIQDPEVLFLPQRWREEGVHTCLVEAIDGLSIPAESAGISLTVEWAFET